MSTHANNRMRPARNARGFTLVELMVTVAIALFLLGGLLTIVQTVRQSNISQQALAQLQDEQRFTITVITDAIQSAGYFANPLTDTIRNFGAAPNPAPTTGTAAFLVGSAFTGFHTVGAADSAARTPWPRVSWSHPATVDPLRRYRQLAGGRSGDLYRGFLRTGHRGARHQLMCSVNGAAPVALVTGVTAMAVYYGVKRDAFARLQRRYLLSRRPDAGAR